MAKLDVVTSATVTEMQPGILMIHNQDPPMIAIVDEVTAGGEGFWGTDLETGTRIEYDSSQFRIFTGTLKLEQ